MSCGYRRTSRSEDPPIERVTGRTRDSDLRGSGFRRARIDFDLVLHAKMELPRKEVIQPQVPLRLPCYDFTPVTSQTLDAPLPTVGSASSGSTSFRGVTGGVYKARERIHRGMLIRDY